MTTKNLSLAAAALVAIAGAYVAGRKSGHDAAGAAGGSGAALPTKAAARSGSGDEVGPGHRHSGRRSGGKSGAVRGEEALAKMEALMRTTDPMERSKAWLDFINSIDPAEFESVVASFRSLGMTDSRMTEYAMLLSAWAKKDPLQALAYANANTGNRFARNTILTAWAAYDPEGAIRWAERHHDGGDGEGNPWMVGVIQGLAEHDPSRATQLLAGMPFSEERGEALDALLPNILAQGPDAARSWAEQIGDEALKVGAIARVAEALAAKDPAGTAVWLASQPAEAAERSMDDVISAWMEQDKEAAVAHYKGMPAGNVRTNALRGVANSMAMEDPRAAADFLDAHAGDANDRVYEQFVWHSFGDAPEIAINYIGKLSNARQQEQLYGRMLDGWLRRDFDAASRWIGSNELPDAVLERVERRMRETEQRQR